MEGEEPIKGVIKRELPVLLGLTPIKHLQIYCVKYASELYHGKTGKLGYLPVAHVLHYFGS